MLKKDPAENKQHVSNLLQAYTKRFKPPQASVEKAFIAAVATVTGYMVKPTQVVYRPATRTIQLHVPSILKNELKRHQSAIQAELHKNLPATEVPTHIL